MSEDGLPQVLLEGLQARMRARYGAAMTFAPGLTTAEFQRLEDQFDLRFPPDLRSWLRFTLPIHDSFPNWRADTAHELQWTHDYLFDGIWGDIDDYGPWSTPQYTYPAGHPISPAWPAAWGPLPAEREVAYTIFCEQFARAPRLIRLDGHRFLPDRPLLAGNPVFSIVQTDIIHLAANLPNLFTSSYGDSRWRQAMAHVRSIEFWTDLAGLNSG